MSNEIKNAIDLLKQALDKLEKSTMDEVHKDFIRRRLERAIKLLESV